MLRSFRCLIYSSLRINNNSSGLFVHFAFTLYSSNLRVTPAILSSSFPGSGVFPKIGFPSRSPWISWMEELLSENPPSVRDPAYHVISLPQEEAAHKSSSGQLGASPITFSPSPRLIVPHEPTRDQISLAVAIA